MNDNTSYNFLTWLTSNTVVDKNSFIFKDDLWRLYHAYCIEHSSREVYSSQCGKIIAQVYPNVATARRRINKKEKWVFSGLRWKCEVDTNIVTNVLETFKRLKPSTYVILNDNATGVRFTTETGFILNDNPVFKFLSVSVAGQCEVTILGKTVPPETLGIETAPVQTVHTVLALFNAVATLKLCQGCPIPDGSRHSTLVLIEKWRSGESENLRCRATHCPRILGPLSLTDHCVKCKNMVFNHFRRNKPPPTASVNAPELCNDDKLEVSDKDTLTNLFPGASDNMQKLLLSQKACLENNEKDPRCRRWDKDIIVLCLSLWNRSPQAYTHLRNSGFLILPSEKLLQTYRNVVKQRPGMNSDSLKWMATTARARNSCTSGGIIFDEMAIQDDLFMTVRGQTAEFSGLLNMGDTSTNMRALTESHHKAQLATHVLQLVFLSFDGFRWPFAYFTTAGLNASDLFNIFWDAVSCLIKYGFHVDYVNMDGASANRAFIKLHSPTLFQGVNMFTGGHITFLMDYSHVIKRIRNNLTSSGNSSKHTRKLIIKGKEVIWDHWIRAFIWDRAENPVRVHRFLTNEHIFLTKTSKMRNHLAEQVLDKNMLYLMTSFQEYIGVEGDDLDQSIELLKHTSILVNIFRDGRPIICDSDERLKQIEVVNAWFSSWEKEISQGPGKAPDKKRMLMTSETREDLNCLLTGFRMLCERKSRENPSTSITPASINSDVVENLFCQQRATHHGANTNPNEAQYRTGLNAVILGQNLTSTKSNAANNSASSALPYSIVCHGPLVPPKKKMKTNVSD